MNERKLKIILACLLTIIIIVLTIFLIFSLTYGKTKHGFFNLNEKAELIKTEKYAINEINKVVVNTKATDIKFVTTDSQEVTINVYGNEDTDVKVKMENNTLDIEYIDSFICVGFCNENSYIEVLMPKEFSKEMDITSVSGDIYLASNNADNIEVKTTSGDMNLENFKKVKTTSTSGEIKIESADDISAKTVSGDINVHNVLNTFDVQTTSGDVDIYSVNINNNSLIKTTSGDIEINQVNDIYIDASTTSGDIEIKKNNRLSNLVLSITTTSGDIEVD